MSHDQVQQLVEEFWVQVGYLEPFPRQLERPIMATKPVFIVKVHRERLDSAYIQRRLQQRGVQLLAQWPDRKLDGCLIAFRGEAAIFVDGTLSPDECRVIIAHEFGHFLADYEWPRRIAHRHLGDPILDVLDGARVPTKQERLAAALSDVRIGVYVHYMDRSIGFAPPVRVSQVEKTAKQVGAELLAPRRIVIDEVRKQHSTPTTLAITSVLDTRFGLPYTFAKWYASKIERHLRRQRVFTDVLGLRPCNAPKGT